MSSDARESQLELYARLAKLLAQVAVKLVRQRDQPEVPSPGNDKDKRVCAL